MELLIVPLLMLAAGGLLFVDVAPGSGAPDDPDPDPTKARTLGPGDNDVSGTAGDDIISLGDGDDVADGMAGDDRIFGDDGADQIAGGPGDDLINLGDGADQNFISGRADADQVAGDDIIRGGGNSDTLIDFLGSNTLYGGQDADALDAVDASGEPASPDQLYGGSGQDILSGDGGDAFYGGKGADLFYVTLNDGPITPAVIHDYEPGETLEIAVPLMFADQTVTAIQTETGLALRLGGQTLVEVRGITDPDDLDVTLMAADLADHTVDPGALRLGTSGDDVLTTSDGDDAVFAGRGDDLVETGAGNDYVSLQAARPFAAEGNLGWGSNTVSTGDGDDRILGGYSADSIQAGTGNDLIVGGGGVDQVQGGMGRDVIDVVDDIAGLSDRVHGGDGADRLVLDDGDVATGGAGADSFEAVDYRAGDAPVRITDFQPGRDSLSAGVPGHDLAVRYVADGADTQVLIGTRTVFVLEGLTPADLSQTSVSVSRTA